MIIEKEKYFMKRTIAAGCIFILVVIVCIGELFILKNMVYGFKDNVNNIIDLVENKEIETAIGESKLLIQKWKGKHTFMSTFIDHEPLKEIELCFSSMKTELEQQETEEFFIESEKALINLEYLNVTEQPLLGNIL